MSYAFSIIKGLTFYNRAKVYTGVILLVPVDGHGVWLIDMMGSIIHYWETSYKPIYAELLPNGNLLYMGQDNNSPLADFEGFGGSMQEIDWDGNVIWQYQDPYLHHAPHRTKEGNTLALKWVKVPEEIAAKVQGGYAGTEREGVMWGDAIQEITPKGEIAWEWIGHEHLDPLVDISCPICPRSEWTHANAVIELPDGNVLASFMETNTIATIDKKTGDIIWRWGGPEGELAHQHSPKVLDNGNILVFDNGLHPRGMARGSSRIIEIKPSSDKMVWSFGGWLESYFYSSTMGSCQKLPNGNIFICESNRGRLFELSPDGVLVWEFVNYLPSYETIPSKSGSCPVFCAYRYGVDYSGLKRPVALPEQKHEAAPGTEDKEEAAVTSRLERLGY
jgi:outer membrane protein assembly factor BamB